MKIEGREVAADILKELVPIIKNLSSRGLTPHLAIILVGSNDDASLSYVRQKEKGGKVIGVNVTIIKKKKIENKKQLFELIDRLNNDHSIHGIIVQRPLSIKINNNELNRSVIPEKDVDGFHPQSPFTPPIASAILRILEHQYAVIKRFAFNNIDRKGFLKWLKKRKILIIGRGVTGGRPIADIFKKKGIKPKIAHSKTKNLKDICLSSDIIISCVGKGNIVRHNLLARDTILIGVGLHKQNGKIKADYDVSKIKDKVSAYTPMPGGVGPVNVACLFENLVKAVTIQQPLT